MPIYEYVCQACDDQFELLVRGETAEVCPSCDSADVERVFSLPKVQSETTQDRALRSAKKRDSKLARERMHRRLEYEQSHDRHG